jgi:hypothetical protein
MFQTFQFVPVAFLRPDMTVSCGWYWHQAFTFAMFFWWATKQIGDEHSERVQDRKHRPE